MRKNTASIHNFSSLRLHFDVEYSTFPPSLPTLNIRKPSSSLLERTEQVQPHEGSLVEVPVLEREGVKGSDVGDENAAIREGEFAPAGAVTKRGVSAGGREAEGRRRT